MKASPLEMTVPAGEPVIEYRRLLAAPPELVFRVFTEPEHLVHWRGPRELRMVACEIDLRAGGRYRYVHRAPDGGEHAFRGEYLEVRPPHRLVSTFEYEGAPGAVATETVFFQPAGEGMLVISRSVLPSLEARDLYLASGAERGLTDSFHRLDAHLAGAAREGVRMRKLIEVTHVSLGGVIGPSLEWAMPYLSSEHEAYGGDLLSGAGALLLGRRTYEGLSTAYTAMAPNPFVDRMNAIPKHVATRSLDRLGWNSTAIEGDLAESVAKLKEEPGGHLLKYGDGPVDVPPMERGLIDEFHLLLTPVAVGDGQHMFESVTTSPALHLADVTVHRNGVVLLKYTPIG